MNRTPTAAAPAAEDETPLSIEAASELLAEGDAPDPAPEGAPTPDAAVEPPFDPPPFWAAEDKAWFAEQPREAQARLLAYEKNRDAATARSLREAAEARKQARAEARGLGEYREALDALTIEAAQRLGPAGWEGVDWAAWADQDPQGAFRGKLQYDTEREALQRLSAARQEVEARAFKAFVEEQAEALEALEPELARDEAKRAEVGRYLASQGYGPGQLRGVSARDLSLARKAMLWDRANAAFETNRSTAQPAPRAVRPGAAVHTPSPRRQTEEAKARFAQTRSREDAIRLLNLRGN